MIPSVSLSAQTITALETKIPPECLVNGEEDGNQISAFSQKQRLVVPDSIAVRVRCLLCFDFAGVVILEKNKMLPGLLWSAIAGGKQGTKVADGRNVW